MKKIAALLAFLPLAGFAGPSIELDTNTCRAPLSTWSTGEAHEFSCQASGTLQADGTYAAFYEGWFLTNRANLGGGEVPDGPIPVIYESDCSVNAGEFRDSSENVYKTSDCRVYLAYRVWGFSLEFGRPERFRVDVVIEMDGLEQVDEDDDDD